MPPSGGIGTGIDREEQALIAQVLVELLPGDAGLDDAIEVFGVDGEHPVHVPEVDRDAAEGRVDAALEGGPGAEGNDRHATAGADAHDLLHVLGRLRKDDGVGRLGRRSRSSCCRAARAPTREVTSRLPNAAASSASAAAIAAGSGRLPNHLVHGQRSR